MKSATSVIGVLILIIPLSVASQTSSPGDQATLLRVTAGAELGRIQPPNGDSTRALRINSAGDIIGNYRSNGLHGFLLRGVEFITIDHPEGIGKTTLLELAESGSILGYFSSGDPRNAQSFEIKYFLRSPNGEFAILKIPPLPRELIHDRAREPRGLTSDGKVIVIETDRSPGQQKISRPSVAYALEGTALRELQGPESPLSGHDGMVNRATQYSGVEKVAKLGSNAVGDIVGTFGHYEFEHCFRLTSRGEMTELVIPGATRCIAMDINEAGEVVGYFNYDGGTDTRGFRWRPGQGAPMQPAVAANPPPAPPPPPPKPAYVPTNFAVGTLIPMNFPGATSTFLSGINASGEIAGEATIDGQHQGFVWSGGRFSSFNYPGGTSISPQNISDAGVVFGTYNLGGVRHHFERTPTGQVVQPQIPKVFDAQGFSPQALTSGNVLIGQMTRNGISRIGVSNRVDFRILFDLPGPYAEVTIRGGNGRGDIVGNMRGSRGDTVGFLLREDGQLTEIAFPGAGTTTAYGVNDGGEITGTYGMSGSEHVSFCFRRDLTGAFSTLPTPAGGRLCSAMSINKAGVIAGSYLPEGQFQHQGFIWEPPGITRSLAAMLETTPKSCSLPTLNADQRAIRSFAVATLVGDPNKVLEKMEEEKEIAKRRMRNAIQLHPEVWHPYLFLGLLLPDAEATPVLEKGLDVARCALNETDPNIKAGPVDVALMQAELGLRYSNLGEKSRAAAALRAALEAAPATGGVALRACIGFSSLQNTDEGAGPCATAVSAFPDSSHAWIAKAELGLLASRRNGKSALERDTVIAMHHVIRLAPKTDAALRYAQLLGVPRPD